ncbi:putative peptidoglycan binding protein [Litoreibacter ponti]|uniref:Putative peptidoglycan binding protein n=1 Tax=Litoreibacter ponti TaxID=1510457 RepID=A0A2T6BNR3_9RHOB|nr:peptidoglycan-binding domain-containing protein [Litoreibacter ponti]PTX57627.1 putative peptidoglycan binding protein [Litoreibacter ponti]
MRPTACLTALLLSVAPVGAADVAFLAATEDYANGRDLRAADEIFDAVAPLQDAGFEVVEADELGFPDMIDALSGFEAQADGSGRIVIALAGHFARSTGETWYLTGDADAPSLVTVADQGISLGTILEIAGRAPGGAVVLLGSEGAEFDYGAGLVQGIGALDIPQGVTVIEGPTEALADFARDELAQPGRSLVTALEGWPSLILRGFQAPLVPFLPADGQAAPVVDPDASEKSLWRVTQTIGTVEGFRNYLQQHPDGLFADEARARIAEIENEPARRAEAAEDALSLNRARRREIQRALSLLDYDPRGIDGIFGPGSRAAIAKWQSENAAEATGFLTGPQLTLLATQAERRAAELEEQARLRQLEIERADRAYWQATGEQGDEAGLRAYLERYPDGVFAEIAQARLKPFEAARREAAATQDRATWDAAVSTGTLAAYQGYLQGNPAGAFAAEAQAKISDLEFQQRNAAALQAAARNEERLGLNVGTRRLIEDRLAKLDLKPGEVDGTFDEETRRAIRRYQEARNLTKTGYLNQATLVRLLADSVLR